MIRFYLLQAGAVGIALNCLSFSASAQAPGAALEEILVTAEFRDTPLLELSTSASVISSDTIFDLAAQHLEDVLGQAPNVNFAGGSLTGTLLPDSRRRRAKPIPGTSQSFYRTGDRRH